MLRNTRTPASRGVQIKSKTLLQGRYTPQDGMYSVMVPGQNACMVVVPNKQRKAGQPPYMVVYVRYERP